MSEERSLLQHEIKSGLPALNPAVIEGSRVNRIMGKLIATAHTRNAQKIAVIAWDSEDTAQGMASLLAGAFSHQLERPCALILAEGVRIGRDSTGLHDTVNVPDVEVPGLSEKVEELLSEMNRAYPVQVFVAPALSEWKTASPAKIEMVAKCHGAILAVPASGLPRKALSEIKNVCKKHDIKLLGIIPFKTGEARHG